MLFYRRNPKNIKNMKSIIYICIFGFWATVATAQTTYFPPIVGTSWDTVSLQSQGWCADKVDSLYTFLDNTNTKGFIVLKNGRIVLEKYFGTFSRDSNWYWASAGKTLTAFTVGIAQQEGFLNLNDSTSKYLGKGWTSATLAQEGKISVRSQLTMTSGLRDIGLDADCTLPSCLVYTADAGTRWAYHNAPYTLLDAVVESATGQSFNAYVNAKIRNKIGMNGAFLKVGYNNINFSTARSMARFGLLLLNKGKWNNINVLFDTTYFRQMTNTSQNFNLAYGYLTWLNGKSSFMVPGSQIVFPNSVSAAAPADMYSALGKNGQIINVVPSQGLVVIRMGDNPDNSLVPFTYTNDIWKLLNKIICNRVGTVENGQDTEGSDFTVFPNPVTTSSVQFDTPQTGYLMNNLGQIVLKFPHSTQNISVSTLPNGVYILKTDGHKAKRLVIQR
jgi:CubicO group peptidase (beta-lactamase class C family)